MVTVAMRNGFAWAQRWELETSGPFTLRRRDFRSGKPLERSLIIGADEDDTVKRLERDHWVTVVAPSYQQNADWRNGCYRAGRAVPNLKLSIESGCLPGIFSPPSNPGDLGRGPIPQGLREIGYVE